VIMFLFKGVIIVASALLVSAGAAADTTVQKADEGAAVLPSSSSSSSSDGLYRASVGGVVPAKRKLGFAPSCPVADCILMLKRPTRKPVKKKRRHLRRDPE
jgi:hypothetical protein